MSDLSRKTTVYFEPHIHQALRLKAANSQQSLSEVVDEAVRLLFLEDQEDLSSFEARGAERTLSYEDLLEDLKANDRL